MHVCARSSSISRVSGSLSSCSWQVLKRMQRALQASVAQTGLPSSRIHRNGVCKHIDGWYVCAEPAPTSFAASYCGQQCSKHVGHGPARSHTVCRAHQQQVDSGHITSHQRLGTDIQISHRQRGHNSVRTPPAAAAAAARGQSQGWLTAGIEQVFWAAPAAAVAGRDLHSSSSSSNSSMRGHCHVASASRSVAAAAAGAEVADADQQVSSRSSSSAGASTASATADVVNSSSSSRSATEVNGDSIGSSASSSSSSTSGSSSSDGDSVVGRYSYRMIISYDGTAYSGWQLQTQASTIQAQIERALSTVLREDRKVLGVSAAGRTDAGVHARGQVVQFFTNNKSIDPDKLPFKLNSLLPHDIRVNMMSATAPDFNVTVSAIRKTYHYHLDLGKYHDPLRMRFSHHCRSPVTLDHMRAAAELLIGTHDFTQFSNESKERLRRNPVKTLERLDIVQESPTALRLEVQGSGFLYKQVRHMVGALLAVGEGKMGLQDISMRLEVGNKQAPGEGGHWRGYNVAPAKGLQLFEVEYPEGVDDPNVLLYPDLPHDEWGRLLMRIAGASSADEE